MTKKPVKKVCKKPDRVYLNEATNLARHKPVNSPELKKHALTVKRSRILD